MDSANVLTFEKPEPVRPYPVEWWKEIDCCLDPSAARWQWDVFDVSSDRHAALHGRKFFYQFLAMLNRHPELIGYNILYDMAKLATRYGSGHPGYRDVYGKAFFEELEKLLLLKVESFNPWGVPEE